MRKLLIGLFGFAALGFGALSAEPAAAQPYYGGYERPYYGPRVEYRARPVFDRHVEYRRPYRAYGPPRHWGRPAYAGPRCFVRPERAWTPYGWVRRPVRVCRW
jgi:hypothetical protein